MTHGKVKWLQAAHSPQNHPEVKKVLTEGTKDHFTLPDNWQYGLKFCFPLSGSLDHGLANSVGLYLVVSYIKMTEGKEN